MARWVTWPASRATVIDAGEPGHAVGEHEGDGRPKVGG